MREVCSYPRLSERLRRSMDGVSGDEVAMGEVMRGLEGRSGLLFILLMSMPYLTPIPVPLLSALSGAVIAAAAVGLLRGHPDVLPEKWLKRKINRRQMERVVRGTSKLLRFLERLTRHRLTWLVDAPPAHVAALGCILAAGVLLMLPIPIPFANTFPAWAIALLAIGLVERDGIFIVAGWVALALTFAWLGGIALLGVQVLRELSDWAMSWVWW